MIKTLRITTVVAVILMGIFFVFSVVFGIRDDERIKRFLDSPGVIKKIENSADSKARISENRASPLVQQADKFALYLNPKSKSKKAQPVSRPTSVARKLAVTPKIKVFGTSYCVNNPEMSLALIDEPGKGWHWVRQSSKVGHLQIEQIKNGLVVVKSSNETFELAVEPSPETSKLTGASSISIRTAGQGPLNPNLLPVAKSHSVTTPEDTPVQIGLIGSDPDSDPLSYIMVSETSHGSLNGTAPNLTYTPNNNFNGSDSFSFKVHDGTEDSTPATVSITVSSVNDPPVANGDIIVTREDTPILMIDVLANDTDIDNEGRYLYLDTFSVTAVTQGKNGLVTINPDGTLSYSPNANFYGSDEFTYTVSDNKGETDTAKINVTVSKVNDAPTITSAPEITANFGTLYTYDVNAIDPDSADTLTYSLTTKPGDMTINSATGLIQWKPTQVGENNVIVKVADSNSIQTTDTQSFTITVNPAPPKMAKLIPLDGYNQRNRKTLSADGKTELVRSSDDNRLVTSYGSYTSYDFSNVSIPGDALIKSVVIYIEHCEEERFASGKLEWSVGKGWPTKPVVWASIKAPVHEEESHEAVDSWDITSLVDTREKLNSLQLQVKNNDNVARRKTLIDYIYVLVEWD